MHRFLRTLPLLALGLLLALPAAAQNLRIYYPDIEQGSSTLVVSPTGRALLIDAGTGLNATDEAIERFINDLIDAGVVTSLDYIIATHYDEDHIGRMENVLNLVPLAPGVVAYDRGEVGGTPSTFAYSDYAFAASLHNRTLIDSTTTLDLGGGVTVRCYTVNGELPDGTSVDISASNQFENSASVTVVVEYGQFQAWIGGDLTGNPLDNVSDVESEVAPFVGDVDVYTFNHHGSHTSSNATFLSTLKAEVGINQNSTSNNFGHPNTAIVSRFLSTADSAGGMPYFFQQNPGNPTDSRSDDSLADGIADCDDVSEPFGMPGTIELLSDGNSYEVRSCGFGALTKLADTGTAPVGDFPPAILSVSRTPLVPLASEGVTVDAEVDDVSLAGVALRWWLDDVEQAPLAMSHGTGLTYSATLPAQLDGTHVRFRVEATDSLAQVELSPAQGYYSGTTAVSDLRLNDADGVLQRVGHGIRVEGNLTVEAGIFHPFVSQVYLQDASGGVQIFDRSLLPLSRGDQVEFVGELEQFAGQTEINISEPLGNNGYTFLAAGTVPAPQVVTVSQVGEALEGRLIRINGVSVVSGTIPETGNGNLVVTDDGGVSTVTLRIDGDTDIPGAATPTLPFDLVGIVSQFDSTPPFDFGYQVLPRERSDLITEEVNLPPLLINELHTDPDPSAGDANGDGTISSSADEFIELVNTGYAALDISGYTISDLVGVRHTFAGGTVVPPREVVVVFGGGTPTGDFGNAAANGLVFTATAGTVALNNSGDTITLRDDLGNVLQTVTYGSEGGDNQSLVRSPDFTNTPLVRHSQAPGSGGSLYSPGTRVDGAPFTVGVGEVLLTEVLYDATGTDGGLEWVELYNASSRTIDLSQLSLGAGGGDYTNTVAQLGGTLAPGATWVVGGPTAGAENGNPVYDQVLDFSPDLQNSGSVADGVALFNVRSAFITTTTVPIDAVRYGDANSDGLIDETGAASAPEVGDAGSGSSIERIDLEGAWQVAAVPNPNVYAPGTPPPPPAALVLSEVYYDAPSGDDGLEWVEIYNPTSESVDLSNYSLGNGGSDYTSSLVQLSGTIAAGATFVVGGPTASADNANPVFDQVVNFSPDFQNSGTDCDGVALFAVPAASVTASTVPLDAAIYGPANNNGLLDETGAAGAPDVADAPAGSSIERTDLAGSWQVQPNPTPNATPLSGGGGTPSTMSVSAIVPSVENQGGGNKLAVVEVTVVDDLGDPVAGADVTGTFTGDFTGTPTETTDANGVATLNAGPQKGPSSYTFCVDNVVDATLSYDSGDNVESCDSV